MTKENLNEEELKNIAEQYHLWVDDINNITE